MRYGADLEEAMALVVEVGVASRVLAVLSDRDRAAALEALREALRGVRSPAGIELGAGAFVVTARTPAPAGRERSAT